jgi:hypothetical protein
MAKSYHFDLGNSSDGPIGFCAVVKADSPEGAVELLKERLPGEIKVPALDGVGEAGEYIEVYFNAEKISTDDITKE